MEFKILDSNYDNIIKLETIRNNIKNIDFYIKNVKEKRFVMVGAYLNNELIGGAYISSSFNSLYIEKIFVKKEYQRNELHVGYNLMKYILSNKSVFEHFFNKEFYYSKLEPNSKEIEQFYNKLGYVSEDNIIGIMKKRI